MFLSLHVGSIVFQLGAILFCGLQGGVYNCKKVHFLVLCLMAEAFNLLCFVFVRALRQLFEVPLFYHV